MKIHSIRQKLLTSSILFGAIMIGATPVIAQEATPPVGTDVSEIVVTGSRIRQANLTTTSPVTQVTSEDIAASGVSRLEDMVTQLPQAFA